MTNPSDYLKELQQSEATQSLMQLRTLFLEFAATLARLPRLAQEVDGWLNPSQTGVDFNAMAARVESQLEAATAWLLDYDMLPAATRAAPAMQTFMQTAAETVTSRTVAPIVRKFEGVVQDVEKSLAFSNATLSAPAVPTMAQTMAVSLSKFHWSPNLPETYVIKNPENQNPAGIGLLASKDYAAFNLAWAQCRGQWKTMTAQRKLVDLFTGYCRTTPIAMDDGATVGDLVLLLTPSKFIASVKADSLLTPQLKRKLTAVAQLAVEMQEPQ